MKEKPLKKVVIINDIDSQSIEKAILILRNGGTTSAAPSGYRIVTEAQEIIHAYSHAMEKNQTAIARKEQRSRRSGTASDMVRRTLCVLIALAGFCTASYFLLQILDAILEKF